MEESARWYEASLLPKLLSDKGDEIIRVSPVSRALSILSNMSSASGLRSHHRRSTPKENHVVADVDNERQMNGPPTPVTEDEESPWYRQIIGKQSRNSLRPSNLTTRTSQRKKNTATMPTQTQVNTESIDDASIVRRQQQTSESFQKVIGDLESLLKEALDLAGRVSRDNSEIDSASPRRPRNGYKRLSTTNNDEQSSMSTTSDEEENRQGHVVVMEPDDEDLYHGHFTKARDATPFPRSLASTRQQSTVPPLDAEYSKQEQVTSINEAPLMANSEPTHYLEPFASVDWALVKRPTSQPPKPPTVPSSLQVPTKEQHSFLIRDHGLASKASGNKKTSRQRPAILPRGSSMKLQRRPTAPRNCPPSLAA